MDVVDLLSGKNAIFSPTALVNRTLRSVILLYLILPVNVVTLWWAYDGQLKINAPTLCRRSMRIGGHQQGTCRHEFEIVHQVALGIELAVDECRLQFEDRHWNCNTTSKYSVLRLFKLDTREAAYVHAIVGAGVLHAVAEACSRGQLLACSCDNSAAFARSGSRSPFVRNPVSKLGNGGGYRLTDEQSTAVLATGDFMWGGCTDDVGFAYEETKKFIDVERGGSNRVTDFRSMIISHNQEAGRLASKSHMRTKCKCHGLSGSCTTKTCWKRVEEFVRVGDRLRVGYDAALQVTVSNVDGNKLVVASPSPPSSSSSLSAGGRYAGSGRSRSPTPLASSYPDSLVYSHSSPDYCRRNRKLGVAGTRGRRCSAAPGGGAVGSCESLCCGRGSRASRITVQQNCHCKFRWCCEVVCQTCFVNETIHTCK